MAPRTDFKIEGARELERLLKQLGPVPARRLGDAALRAGGKVIVDRAKQLVPVDTGDLRDGITVQVERRQNRDDQRQAKIGVERPVSRIAHLVEFGTSKMAAQPFLTPALDERVGEALNRIGEVLGRGIEREAEKLAGIRGKRRR